MNINIEIIKNKKNLKKLLKIEFMMEDYQMKSLKNLTLLVIIIIQQQELRICMEKNLNLIHGINLLSQLIIYPSLSKLVDLNDLFI